MLCVCKDATLYIRELDDFACDRKPYAGSAFTISPELSHLVLAKRTKTVKAIECSCFLLPSVTVLRKFPPLCNPCHVICFLLAMKVGHVFS